MQHLTNADTNDLVCFVCTFEISTWFLGMKQELATKMFGLTKYCDTYGRMSESGHLAESHKSFDDWHLRAP